MRDSGSTTDLTMPPSLFFPLPPPPPLPPAGLAGAADSSLPLSSDSTSPLGEHFSWSLDLADRSQVVNRSPATSPPAALFSRNGESVRVILSCDSLVTTTQVERPPAFM